MKWVNGIKLSLSLFLLFFLTGCLRQQAEHSGMECQVGKVNRNVLITPTEHPFSSQPQNSLSNLVNTLPSSIHNQLSKEDALKQCQILFEDVAIPIIAVPVDYHCEQSGSVHMVYHLQMELSELLLFLKNQMEQFGWQQTIALESTECLLSFVKPNRFCVISIRPLKKDFKASGKKQLIYFIGSN
jgi:hypothetical protein